MQTRNIGSLEVSVVGLGCNNFGWRLDASATTEVVHAALDAGVTFFDTADIYGETRSEQFLGRALGDRRHQAIIATKFGSKLDEDRKGARPEYVRRAAEDSLRRLGTDCIDLYQLHWPDPEVPIAETLGAMQELVQAGKVREIGCSNFSVDQIQAARRAAGDRRGFVSVQNHYSLLHREPEGGVLAACDKGRTAFLPYFPLANGLLTGKYRQGQAVPESGRIGSSELFAKWLTEENLARVESFMAFAKTRGRTLLELAVSWLLARPVVASVIAGATTPQQVVANVAAATWQLTQNELIEVDTLAPLDAGSRRNVAG